jgi:general secretion pathway protein E
VSADASIEAAQIAQARQAAAATRRRVVDVLEEAAGGDPDGFTARLAASLQLERLAMADLRAAAPAFDLLPFNECSQHGCALLRAADGRLILAFDDPFSGELHAWAEERIAQPFSCAPSTRCTERASPARPTAAASRICR